MIKANSNDMNEALSAIYNGLEEMKVRISDGFTLIEEKHERNSILSEKLIIVYQSLCRELIQVNLGRDNVLRAIDEETMY
jgi:hypothetical protein